MRPIHERFWAKVDKDIGPVHPEYGKCWMWTGYTMPGHAYGQIGNEPGKRPLSLRAHRVAWELAVGPIPKGLYVLHDCDNPKCVRPAHLSVGTQKDNMRDMDARNRRVNAQPSGEDCAHSRLTANEVRSMRREHAAGERQVDLAKKYAISQAHVSQIIRGTQWRSVLEPAPQAPLGDEPVRNP
jgi:hypothetical protein